MNKYEIGFDMFKNKILFVFERCEDNDNKISTSKDLFFYRLIYLLSLHDLLNLLLKMNRIKITSIYTL